MDCRSFKELFFDQNWALFRSRPLLCSSWYLATKWRKCMARRPDNSGVKNMITYPEVNFYIFSVLWWGLPLVFSYPHSVQRNSSATSSEALVWTPRSEARLFGLFPNVIIASYQNLVILTKLCYKALVRFFSYQTLVYFIDIFWPKHW